MVFSRIIQLLFLLFYISLNPAYAEVRFSGDTAFASLLWQQMEQVYLTGKSALQDKLFVGAAPPHGWVLEVLFQNVTVGGHTGFIVVKRNYNKRNVEDANPTIEEVEANREKYHDSITVMYQRELAYDPDNQGWFWAKYRPDGSLFKKKIGGKLTFIAGRMVKGKTPEENGGCIYCHRSAGGGDYIFYPHIKNPNKKE